MDEWDNVYGEYADDVFRFLVHFVGNREDAKDLTQEAFIKAFSKWEKFDHRSGVKTWIFTIARNLAVDRLRKKHRFNTLLRLFRNEPADNPVLPEQLVSMDEGRQTLYKVIQSLQPNYRSVMILHGIQEYTFSETASILGWSENKTKVNFHRAMKSLRHTLREGGNTFYEFI